MDIDADGNVDLLSGCYSSTKGSAMAGEFHVLYGSPEGEFSAPEVLRGDDGNALLIPSNETTVTDAICTRPWAADLDGDGLLDIVTGNFSGTFFFFSGNGSGKFASEGKFLSTADGKSLKVQHHSDPFLIDWDADGDLDILSGSAQGGVKFIQNTGTGKEPKFAAPATLVAAPKDVYSEELRFGDEHITGPQGSTRVWAADVNKDGKLDLLIGDTVRLNYIAGDLSPEDVAARQKVWDEEFQRILAEQPDIDFESPLSAEDQERMNAHSTLVSTHYEKRKEFIDERPTGFVWLLLAK